MKKLTTKIAATLAAVLCAATFGLAVIPAAAPSGARVAESNVAAAAAPSGAQVVPTGAMLVSQSLATAEVSAQGNTASNWGLESIYATDAQRYVAANPTAANPENPVCIAVLDTGFYVDHLAIQGKVKAAWDATACGAPQLSYDYPTGTGKYKIAVPSALESAVDVTPGAENGDPNHGTHVAAIAAGNAYGAYTGVAPDANLVLIKVGNDKGEVASWALYNAYELILKYANMYNIRVVNFSGGISMASMPASATENTATASTTWDSLVLGQIDRAYEVGIVTVCSAGNEGTTGINFPSDYDKVVSVMSLAMRSSTPTDVVLDSKSNRNPSSAAEATATKDICAPGKNVVSAVKSGDSYTYGKMSGTSMAAPHVAGTLALMFASNSSLAVRGPTSAQAAIDLLYSTTTDLGVAGWDTTYAHGEVNAAAAVGASVIQGPSEILVTPGTTPINYTYSVIGAGADESWTWSADTDKLYVGKPSASSGSAVQVYGLQIGTVTLTATRKTGADADASTITLEKTVTVTPLDFSRFGTTGYPVTAKSPDFEFSNEMNSQVYTGSACKPRVGVRVKSYELVEGTDYAVSYSNNLNASSKARFTITGLWSESNPTAKFKGSWTGVFTIRPAALTSTGVALSRTRMGYTGKALTPTVTVKCGSRTLAAGADYTVVYSGNTKPGTAKATVVGKGNYAGTVVKHFTITKASNTMTVQGLTKKVKYSKARKKAQTLARPITVKGAKGTVTYAKKSGNKKITVNKKTGKVTVKKGLKKGKYKVKINVTAAGNAYYSKATKPVVATIRVV